MCIILDANRCGVAFATPPASEARPVLDWVTSGGGRIVYGGKLKAELQKNSVARQWMAQALRRGRAREVDARRIREEEAILKDLTLRSDDVHVLALARAGGARLIYTHDQALIEDFKDPAILNKPRGKVYKNEKNQDLLTRNVCAP
jgi:predicted nucleic acid-binding protein